MLGCVQVDEFLFGLVRCNRKLEKKDIYQLIGDTCTISLGMSKKQEM